MPTILHSGSAGTIFGFVALACYAFSAGFYIAFLKKPRPLFGWLATGLAATGALLNLESLYARSVALKSVPYRDIVGSLALLGFLLAVLNILLELRHRDRSLGPFLMPVVFVLLLVALELPMAKTAPAPELRGPVFALHVTLNMLGYAAFAVACALSALYLMVGRSLKRKKGLTLDGPFSRFPSLSYLERANRTSLGVGVVASTAAFCLGAFWATRVWRADHPNWVLDPKIVTVLLILVFYWVVLVRAHRGAAPVTTARLSVAGFLLVLVSYTAINLLFSKLHVFT
ncbi:MAG: cytochrome c biogenesis protein [Thermoanaerobaculia bacterium]|nr:cytochrome c biogenesis protein [Thermoanaerobaculia bacterium]